MIPFNKPYLSGKELVYIEDAVKKERFLETDILHNKAMIFSKPNWNQKNIADYKLH